MTLLKQDKIIEIISKSKKCHFCGSSEQLVVHHIDRNRHSNPINGTNWLVICRSCHQKLHFYLLQSDYDIRQKIINFVKSLAEKSVKC